MYVTVIIRFRRKLHFILLVGTKNILFILKYTKFFRIFSYNKDNCIRIQYTVVIQYSCRKPICSNTQDIQLQMAMKLKQSYVCA